MSDKTNIEWTDASWNVITGCSVKSAGCKNCYAMKLAGTRLKHHPSRTGLTQETANGPVWTGEVRFNDEWLNQPLKWKRPRKIFVCAHADLFHENMPFDWIDKVFAVMALAPQHTFQVLTKRPERMLAYLSRPAVEVRVGLQAFDFCLQAQHSSGGTSKLGKGLSMQASDINPGGLAIWPLPNVWIGCTVENQETADERIPLLLQTPAAVRWVSMEPLLGPVDLTHISPKIFAAKANALTGNWKWEGGPTKRESPALDWVVVGGESGQNARPMHPDWARSLRDQCAAAGVPFLFKQWGTWADLTKDEAGSALHQKATGDNIFTSTGKVLGAGYKSRYGCGGMVEENWREKGGAWMGKVGKKAAGRLLDGVQHDGYPEIKNRS